MPKLLVPSTKPVVVISSLPSMFKALMPDVEPRTAAALIVRPEPKFKALIPNP